MEDFTTEELKVLKEALESHKTLLWISETQCENIQDKIDRMMAHDKEFWTRTIEQS